MEDTRTRPTSLRTERTGQSQPRPLRLVVTAGPDRGRSAVLEEGTAVVGTRNDCTLVLTDGTVSRQHLSVELFGDRLRVTDLGSRNGTRFHGAKLRSVDVPFGATLVLGKTSVALLSGEQEAPALSERTQLGPLWGQSLPMRRLFAILERIGPTDAPVLVQGETGSGKEGVARALHLLSSRSQGPLQVLDCGAVQQTLLPGALFGHARGAFTGAVAAKEGVLEAAHFGTLFLDEVGELPLEVQPAFLRALETRSFQRLGETSTRTSDFRLVAATHRNLESAVAKGTFRSDLYHRLASMVVQVPPLRERAEDIPLLAERFCQEEGKPLELPPGLLATLGAYHWPGNVRELRNVVQRALALGAGSALPDFGPLPEGEKEDFHQARERVVKAFEKSYLQAQLQRHQGSAAAAAKEAGLARSYFYRLLETHQLKPGQGRR